MAHTKAGGSTKLGRDSTSKRLGIKINHGESAGVGEIIVRQRGTHYFPGKHVKRAGDDTLYAMKTGTVQFASKKRTRFDGSRKSVTFVSVLPSPKQ